MKQLDYEEWFDKHGIQIVDDIEKWVDTAPDIIDVVDLIGTDIDSFIQELLEDNYQSDYEDYCDRAYDEYRDEKMLEEFEDDC